MPADDPSPDPGDEPEGAHDPDGEPGDQDGAGKGDNPDDGPDGEPGDQDGAGKGDEPEGAHDPDGALGDRDGAGEGDDPDDDGPGGELGYAAARAELDAILAELSVDDLDVDVLAERVERASTLIEICRGRITNARIQVERVMAAGPGPAGQT